MKTIGREEKLYIQTFREVRSYIIQNGLGPGDLLPTEQVLCQTLGISRNVLREAIKSMELMGMVQASPGRGTVIKEFSLDHVFQNVLFFRVRVEDKPVREMFGIRKNLELSYMRQAFRAVGGEEISQMRQSLEQMKQAGDDSDAFLRADRDFHMTLFRPLNNGVLNSLLEAIWAADDGFQLEKKSPHLINSTSKHEAIVEALERYEYRAFAQAMEAHFSSGKYSAVDSYEEY